MCSQEHDSKVDWSSEGGSISNTPKGITVSFCERENINVSKKIGGKFWLKVCNVRDEYSFLIIHAILHGGEERFNLTIEPKSCSTFSYRSTAENLSLSLECKDAEGIYIREVAKL